MFEQAVLDGPRPGARGVSFAFALSLTLQVALVGTALLVPLLVIEGPKVVQLSLRILPPPPPPPAVELVRVPREVVQRFMREGRLFAPAAIPTKIANVREEPILPGDAPEISTGGGVPGGIAEGVPGGVLPLIPRLAPPPPAEKAQAKPAPPPQPKLSEPVRRGGEVQAAMLLNRVMPAYPPLAKQARISGTVKLIGIINKEGRIVSLQLVSGHPLLAPAAIEAVRQWVYKPTLLNGEPVEVIAPIDVNFVLGR